MEATENEDVVIIKDQTACFTGHREIPVLHIISLRRKLKRTIISCINDGYRFFGAGGALGFDTLAAKTVLDLSAVSGVQRTVLRSKTDAMRSRAD